MAQDFSLISPSAKALLLVKAQTSLPYARASAGLLFGEKAVEDAARETAKIPGAAARRDHFEARSRSIDEAVAQLGATRIVELAAGLSFRGLAMAAAREDVVYLDTDLPGIVEIKADLLAKLRRASAPLAGTLTVRALDALDRAAFRDAVGTIPAGPFAIVQEGLLMYLDDAEKAALAANVREVLAERGGAWVTADVYVRGETSMFRSERTKAFVAEHRIEEKKFADWAAAETFFTASGFRITSRLGRNGPYRIRETWVLSPTA